MHPRRSSELLCELLRRIAVPNCRSKTSCAARDCTIAYDRHRRRVSIVRSRYSYSARTAIVQPPVAPSERILIQIFRRETRESGAESSKVVANDQNWAKVWRKSAKSVPLNDFAASLAVEHNFGNISADGEQWLCVLSLKVRTRNFTANFEHALPYFSNFVRLMK